MEYIKLEPDWENTALYFAECLRNHDFEKGAGVPVISFIEQIRYLQQTKPEALERIMEELKRHG